MQARRKFALTLTSGVLVMGERTLLMVVLYVNPDYFREGGHFLDSFLAL